MKIVVLGGSGFMGSHLCDLLSSKGHKVNIFDIKKSKYKKKNQKMYIGSILDKKELSLAVRGCDFVYHFAALADLDIASNEPLKSAKINIVGTINALEICKKYNIKRFIFASSIYANAEEGSFYGSSKQAAEIYIEKFYNNFGLNYTILRFSNVYGAYSLHKSSAIHQMMRCLKKNKLFKIHGTGKQLRDFIYVEDLLKKINKIYKKNLKKNFYNINTNKLNSINEIVKILNSFSNKTLKTKHVKAPVGYDVSFFKKAKVRRNANLILNLKKTFNWYNSKKL